MSDGFLLWRWEQTVSYDNQSLAPVAKECMDRFWYEYGWSSLILISSYRPNTNRILYHGDFVNDDQFEYILFQRNEHNTDNRRFLWYWIRKLYDFGSGGLRLYIDSDRRFIDQIRKDRVDFPVSAPHQFVFEKLVTRVRKHREMKIRQKEKTSSYLTS